MAPLSGYINIPIDQELTDEPDYNGNTSDGRVYLDLRVDARYTTEM